MGRLWKWITIRHRAYKLGCRLRERYLGPSGPGWNNTARTLIRLNRIKHGKPPFRFVGKWLGEVPEFKSILRQYGNLRPSAPSLSESLDDLVMLLAR